MTQWEGTRSANQKYAERLSSQVDVGIPHHDLSGWMLPRDHPQHGRLRGGHPTACKSSLGRSPTPGFVILTLLPVILMLEVREMYGAWGFRFNGTTFTKVASVDRHCYQFEQSEFKFHGVTLGVLNLLQSPERT